MLVRYGDATYGIYLLHAPVLIIFDTLARDTFHLPAAALLSYSQRLGLGSRRCVRDIGSSPLSPITPMAHPREEIYSALTTGSTAKAA